MTLAWWQEAVFYQIYPRSFKDSTGNGIGDLQGVVNKLDYLVELGIDAIWLSPFYPSPMNDFGYDIADYRDVDPMFGDLETMDTLIQAAHQRDIKIVIDYVPNHSSDEHEWFKESSSSRDNPKADWYIWKDAKADGSPPNNWGSVFGGSAWEWEEARQQYYFHQFEPSQPDLNWRNPEVKQAMLDVLRFWMERRVDGFRMDVVYMIWKHPEMPDQPLVDGASGRGADDIYGTQEQIYSMNYDGIHDVMKEIRATLDEFDDRVMIGEIWLDLAERLTYYGDGDEFHMPFNFSLLGSSDFLKPRQWSAEYVRDEVDKYETALKDNQWPNYVLGNHDVQRVATRVGEAQTRVAAMLLLTLRGTPTIYNGDEIGMVDGDITEDDIEDPQGHRLGLHMSRDFARTPLQWDDSALAGFSPEGTESTWLPVTHDYKERNIQAQMGDNDSLWTLYQQLLTFRQSSKALLSGAYESVDSPQGTFVYHRTADDDQLLIALNFTGENKTINVPDNSEIILQTHQDSNAILADGVVTLGANEGIVLRL